MTEWRVDELVSGDIHVSPNFGKRHLLDVCCWCHPEPDKQEEAVIIHNVEQ